MKRNYHKSYLVVKQKVTLLWELGDTELFDRVVGHVQEPPASVRTTDECPGRGQLFQTNRLTAQTLTCTKATNSYAYL